MIGRKSFVLNLIGGLSPLLAIGHNRKKKNLIVHHTLFWLRKPRSIEDKNELVKNLRTLEKIEYHRTLIGIPLSDVKYDSTDSSYDVSIVTYFDDANGRIAYENHPVHKKFVEQCSSLWEKKISYDTICEIR